LVESSHLSSNYTLFPSEHTGKDCIKHNHLVGSSHVSSNYTLSYVSSNYTLFHPNALLDQFDNRELSEAW